MPHIFDVLGISRGAQATCMEQRCTQILEASDRDAARRLVLALSDKRNTTGIPDAELQRPAQLLLCPRHNRGADSRVPGLVERWHEAGRRAGWVEHNRRGGIPRPGPGTAPRPALPAPVQAVTNRPAAGILPIAVPAPAVPALPHQGPAVLPPPQRRRVDSGVGLPIPDATELIPTLRADCDDLREQAQILGARVDTLAEEHREMRIEMAEYRDNQAIQQQRINRVEARDLLPRAPAIVQPATPAIQPAPPLIQPAGSPQPAELSARA